MGRVSGESLQGLPCRGMPASTDSAGFASAADGAVVPTCGPVLAAVNAASALCLSCVLALGATACSSARTGEGSWAYTGPDQSLRAPAFRPSPGATQDELRGQAQRALQDWQQRSDAALAQAKEQCARQSGEPAVPGAWSGYGRAFLACMTAAGWSRVGNPG